MNCGPTPCVERPPTSVGVVASSSASSWILVATVLGSSMDFIDGTVVNVALPSLQSSFGATGTQVQWVVEAYALFLSALLLTGGSVGDRFGLRNTFLAGVVLFGSASVWCGFAPSLHQLLLARCLQGAAGALLVPNSLALLSASFSGAERGRAIGTWSGFASMMTALGPVVGGYMVQHGSWRWVFFLNIPIGVTTVWITLAKINPIAPPRNTKAFDWLGAILGTAALSLITFSLMEWEAGQAYTHFAGLIGLTFLATFVYVEGLSAAPLMPVDLFRSRNFTGANLLTFFLYAALAGTLFYLPLNLIQIQGYSPTQAGAAMLPLVVIMFTLSRWAGGLIPRYGAKLPLVLGPMITAGGYALLAIPGVGGAYWKNYLPAMLVLGLGMSISVAPLTTLVMSSVDQRRAGAASGVNNTISQTSALLALAICSPLFYLKFSDSLPKHLQRAAVSAQIAEQIEQQKRRLGAIQTQDASAKSAVDESFVGAFRLITLFAGLSAAAAGITAACTIRNGEMPGKPAKR
jgi:EmrB/QacA subfamily drug resistance transporter